MSRDDPDPVLITDAAPSFEDEQAVRRRRYTILMIVHIVGFALAGVLYYQAWWLGLVLIILTTPLPWVAVIVANSPVVQGRQSRAERRGRPELTS